MPKVYEHIEVVELLVKNLQTHLVCRSKVKDKSQLNRLPGKSVVKKLILKFEKVVCRLRGLCTDEEMRQYDRNVGVNDDGDDDYDDEDA